MESYKSLGFVGVMNGLATMFLIWIIFFTMLHEEELTALGNAQLDTITENAVDEDVIDVVQDEIPTNDQSEF